MATQIKRMARAPADCPVTERRQPHCGQDTNYNFRSHPPDGRRDQALHIQHSHVLVLVNNEGAGVSFRRLVRYIYIYLYIPYIYLRDVAALLKERNSKAVSTYL